MKCSFKNLFIALFVFLFFPDIKINNDGDLILQKTLFAQDNNSFWNDIPSQDFKIINPLQVLPLKYRSLKLNLNSFRNILVKSPFELSDKALTSPFVIEIPSPDGKFSKFFVTEYSIMEPGLGAQFPEIKTYNVKGIDDPYAVGKIDITMSGFHGMILTPNGDYFIDPVNLDNTENYISYYKSDYKSSQIFQCLVNEEISSSDISVNINYVMTGQQLRTYRLACAATGEYTAFHGGTVALGQAAIVTAINRVNGVYERDVSVRMILVANNNLIVYTNSATDPYTNGSGSTMLGQNQTNLTNVIGSANYDIGHVFSTGGGGVAGLGVVCSSSNKARGVTGLPSPIGDPFYIDYVAHEMGHQYRGNHTFNGNAGSCAGNRNASTAWEPGSGSTIMPYAGICGAQDLQPNSDAYFHSGSVSEIAAFTQTSGGNACPVTTVTGNTPPTVTVPAGGFTIPVGTPFELTGSATDAESPGTLTYCWEEFDLGAAGAPNAPVGNAPIFRSFNPVVASTRTFPKLTDLLNNTSTIGEILPTYTRNLNFRLTVRDNSAGGGGIDFGSIAFNVSSVSGPFLVTSPNTTVSWNSGLQTVTWNVANTTASPVSCALVNIKLSTDGGNTFPTTLISNTDNDGSEDVNIPNISSTTARIKVESSGNVFFDISNTNFTIEALPAPVANTVGLMSQGMFINISPYWSLADTIRLYLHRQESPSIVVDSSVVVISGQPYLYDVIFNNALSGNYYLVIKHRNSLETWSNTDFYYSRGTSFFKNFITPGASYGDNMILLIPTEIWRGMYSGDVNRDNAVDLSDVSLIENAASNFASGYVVEDLTGDNFVDLNDLAIADNNAYNFVTRQAPPGAEPEPALKFQN